MTKPSDADSDPDQWWFWTPEWQAGEREASEQIAAGDVTFCDNDEEMFSFLNRRGESAQTS